MYHFRLYLPKCAIFLVQPAAEVFELAEEALDLVTLAVERLAEAGLPLSI